MLDNGSYFHYQFVDYFNKVTSLKCFFFCSTNTPKLQYIEVTVILNKDKQHIFMFKKLDLENL